MIADAYFQCKPESLDAYNMAVIKDDGETPLGVITHAYAVYRDPEKVICHCRLDEPSIKALAEAANTMNPLDISVVIAMGITWTYLGRTSNGVFERYPELNGTKIVMGETGMRVEPIVASHIWA